MTEKDNFRTYKTAIESKPKQQKDDDANDQKFYIGNKR